MDEGGAYRLKKSVVQPAMNYSGSFANKALRNILIVVAITAISVYVGSEQLMHVDLALSGYLIATVLCFALFALRITAWTLRPPTRRLWKQGLRLMTSAKGLRFLFRSLGKNIGSQDFIHKRSIYRGLQHVLISWGVLFSFGITFALVLNWMHFELVEPQVYEVVVFGIPLFRMGVDSWLAIMLYHGLNWTGIAVIIGCAMAMVRRIREREQLVEQSNEYDLFPLVLLIAISVTGSLLTVSALWMEGVFYMGIAVAHEITVVVFLLYLPFSKFWHIPLRFLGVVVPLYHAMHEEKACVRCGVPYATRTQIEDVQHALKERGVSAPIQNTTLHMSDMCSACRRISNRIAAFGGTIGLERSGSTLANNGRNGLIQQSQQRQRT
jgi:hypothetical protein